MKWNSHKYIATIVGHKLMFSDYQIELLKRASVLPDVEMKKVSHHNLGKILASQYFVKARRFFVNEDMDRAIINFGIGLHFLADFEVGYFFKFQHDKRETEISRQRYRPSVIDNPRSSYLNFLKAMSKVKKHTFFFNPSHVLNETVDNSILIGKIIFGEPTETDKPYFLYFLSSFLVSLLFVYLALSMFNLYFILPSLVGFYLSNFFIKQNNWYRGATWQRKKQKK